MNRKGAGKQHWSEEKDYSGVPYSPSSSSSNNKMIISQTRQRQSFILFVGKQVSGGSSAIGLEQSL